MSFRKINRKIPSSSSCPSPPSSSSSTHTTLPSPSPQSTSPPGVRPSPLTGTPTTSTGTPTLDSILAGHYGLPLGTSLLLEENGTTDYAGTLLRFMGAEGVVQGHRVVLIGVGGGEGGGWGRELPGVVEEKGRERELAKADGVGSGGERREVKEKMKIAWRYERLGEFGSRGSLRGGLPLQQRDPPSAPGQRTPDTEDESTTLPKVFCHTFDLTKRLTITDPAAISYIPIRPVGPQTSPFTSIIQSLTQHISSSPLSTIHRILIPALLSPAFYPPHASHPHNLLPFLHSLRSLLRQYPTRLALMFSLPLTLYPRSTGLTRWIELLSDGVIELLPFPHTIDTGPSLTTSGAATSSEDRPQGMVKIHRLPIFHERGGGGVTMGDDLAFTVSRRKFLIKPFSLPPVDGDLAAQRGSEADGGGGGGGGGKPSKADMEF
ncbi:MAG: hypothetical protein MMC33_007671 [Icmadophila ericetorum]|nr:hypothetical protein [Icmadophila ericetorum]